jgi:hypothetical protein
MSKENFQESEFLLCICRIPGSSLQEVETPLAIRWLTAQQVVYRNS